MFICLHFHFLKKGIYFNIFIMCRPISAYGYMYPGAGITDHSELLDMGNWEWEPNSGFLEKDLQGL